MLRNDLYKPWFVSDNQWGVEIISGEFSGVIVQLEKLEFAEDGDEGNLNVEYHVIHKPEIITEEETKGDLFKSTFELIINDVIREALDIAKNEQNRDDDTKEPDTE